MDPEEARAELAGPVEFERRSTYWACLRCGSMVSSSDRDRHRRAHQAVTDAFRTPGTSS